MPLKGLSDCLDAIEQKSELPPKRLPNESVVISARQCVRIKDFTLNGGSFKERKVIFCIRETSHFFY